MKKIFKWFKELELYQVAIGIFFAFIIFLLVMIPFEIYKESITHYDLTVTYINGESEVIHCRSYNCDKTHITYYTGDSVCCIYLDSVAKYESSSIKCDCDSV